MLQFFKLILQCFLFGLLLVLFPCSANEQSKEAVSDVSSSYDYAKDYSFFPLVKKEYNNKILNYSKKQLLSNKSFPKIKNKSVFTQANLAHKNGTKKWKNLTPGFMNVPINVIIHKDTITVGIDIGGLLQSKDAGKTWKHISHNSYSGITNNTLIDFDISPSNPNKLLIATRGGIYHSKDGGISWTRIKQNLPEPQFLTNSTYYGQIKFNANGTTVFCGIGSLWHFDSQKVPLSVQTNHPHKELFISFDGGNTFSSYIIANKPFANLKRIYTHPTNKDVAYFSFEDGEYYVTFNATDTKIFFKQIPLPSGYFLRDMSVNPFNKEQLILLLSSHEHKKKPLLYISNNCTKPTMSIKELSHLPYRGKDMLSVGFNPNKLNQILIGEAQSNAFLLSNDGGKNFERINVSDKFLHNTLDKFYTKIDTIYFGTSPYAILASKVGLWITKDNFKSLEELTMTYNQKWFGNRGVSAIGNINSLQMANNNTYFSAQDHGAWISKGDNLTQWKPLTGEDNQYKFPKQKVPWGSYTWLQNVEKIFVSSDENYIFLFALKYSSKYKSFKKEKKVFRSKNHGRSWEDITSSFGKGSIFPGGNQIKKLLFNPKDSSEQWTLFTNELYYTKNGGNSFTKITHVILPNFLKTKKIEYTDIAYDAAKDILYLSVGNTDSNFNETLYSGKTPAALYKSYDKGKTWNIFDIGQTSIKSIGLTQNSNIVVATSKTTQKPALLLTIPYNSSGFKKEYIKLTYGDTIQEIETNGLQFNFVRTDGKYVLVYANTSWIFSDLKMPQGPYLSMDNGKSFEFIQYDLPQNSLWSAAIKNKKILLGTTFGLMYYEIK